MGRYSGKRCRLLSMFTLTAGYFLVEIVVGYVTNSMALVADSFHMLSDVIAIIVAFLSVRMSPRKWSKNTFGWARAEVLGALVNSVFLAALCFSLMVEAVQRFFEPKIIENPELLLSVGSLGLLVNIIGLILFRDHGNGHSHRGHHHSLPTVEDVMAEDEMNENTGNCEMAANHISSIGDHSDQKEQVKLRSGSQMNMHGVFLHVLADAMGSVAVIVSALIIWLSEWEYRVYVDPSLTLIIVCLILKSTWPLLVDSALILLQTVPTHIQIDSLQKKLVEEIDGVIAVHEFHVWQLAGDRIIASAHIRCRNLADYMKIAEKVKEFFHAEGIHSTTIQPEFTDMSAEMMDNSFCMLNCPAKMTCVSQTCCGPQQTNDDSPKAKSSPETVPKVENNTSGNGQIQDANVVLSIEDHQSESRLNIA